MNPGDSDCCHKGRQESKDAFVIYSPWIVVVIVLGGDEGSSWMLLQDVGRGSRVEEGEGQGVAAMYMYV